jgi:hypothetical protein
MLQRRPMQRRRLMECCGDVPENGVHEDE